MNRSRRSNCDCKYSALLCCIVKVSEVELNSNNRLVLLYLEDAVFAVEGSVNRLAYGIHSLFLGTPVDTPRIGNGVAFLVYRVSHELDLVVIEGVDVLHCDFPDSGLNLGHSVSRIAGIPVSAVEVCIFAVTSGNHTCDVNAGNNGDVTNYIDFACFGVECNGDVAFAVNVKGVVAAG